MELNDAIDKADYDVPCRQAPDLFFVDNQGEYAYTKMAINMCQTGCPVQNECLAYALEFREDEGVWGGTTAGQRRNILKAKRQRTIK